MTIKLHLFRSQTKPGILLGHLYSDSDDLEELCGASDTLKLNRKWLQKSNSGVYHFDLWGGPLEKAKDMFEIGTPKRLDL